VDVVHESCVLRRIRQQQFWSDDAISLCDLRRLLRLAANRLQGTTDNTGVCFAGIRPKVDDRLKATTPSRGNYSWVEPFKEDRYITLAVTLSHHTAGGVRRIKRVTPFVTIIRLLGPFDQRWRSFGGKKERSTRHQEPVTADQQS